MKSFYLATLNPDDLYSKPPWRLRAVQLFVTWPFDNEFNSFFFCFCFSKQQFSVILTFREEWLDDRLKFENMQGKPPSSLFIIFFTCNPRL